MEVDEEEVQKYYDEMSVAYEDYELYYEKYGYYPPTVEVAPETYQDIVVVFDNPAEIAEIKKHLVYRQYTSEFGPFPVVESYLNPEVYFENPPTNPEALYWDGIIGWTERFRFVEGEIPQFVFDRLFEELGSEEY
jgi:hypothetical protein